jgi:hypothetical protein
VFSLLIEMLLCGWVVVVLVVIKIGKGQQGVATNLQ